MVVYMEVHHLSTYVLKTYIAVDFCRVLMTTSLSHAWCCSNHHSPTLQVHLPILRSLSAKQRLKAISTTRIACTFKLLPVQLPFDIVHLRCAIFLSWQHRLPLQNLLPHKLGIGKHCLLLLALSL